MDNRENKNPIQVADRLFQVLETLADDGPAALSRLCRKLDLNKSTVHRLLCSLSCLGYVRQDAETQKYELTLKLLTVSSRLLSHMDILELVRPYLRRLSRETGETVHFVKLDGSEAVYIYKEESDQNSVRMVSRVGTRVPFYCSGVGKAMAAQMSEEQVRELWDGSAVERLTPHTITDFTCFLENLREVRAKGYALDDEENETGVRCIAASIDGIPGSPRYAFSISAPTARLSDERIPAIAERILEVRKEMMERR